jgi:hypothetical protein
MMIDSKEQQVMLTQIVEAMNFSGKDVEAVYDLKKAIKGAEIAGQEKPKEQ